jgi:hypothetical protein
MSSLLISYSSGTVISNDKRSFSYGHSRCIQLITPSNLIEHHVIQSQLTFQENNHQ